jgi:hypothetical protein
VLIAWSRRQGPAEVRKRRARALPGSGAHSRPSHPPIAILNAPAEGANVPNKILGTGWALDDSGIASVTATVDGGPPFRQNR